MATKKAQPEKVVVPAADSMLAMVFRKHTETRHDRTMRFRSKGEHVADHRLHADLLDHVHEDQIPAEEEE